MEARIGGAHHFYGTGIPNFLLKEKELKRVGKKTMDWDLNDWKWDGDLFIATPRNAPQGGDMFEAGTEIRTTGDISHTSSSGSEEINMQSERSKRELEKRRRIVVIEDDELNGETENLTLKLGGNGYPTIEDPNWEGKNGKKIKLLGGAMNHAVCQVEDCGADLSKAKDYHRRHKVCEVHSKASKALVGNVMQRFCQQCSRFHFLQEFDEGRRSCRRRLAGHNKRRRKTQPDAVANGNSLNDDQSSTYLLISLLRIISNMHTNKSDESKSQDILSHLLRNLAGLPDSFDGRNISGLLQESHDMLNVGRSDGTSSKISPALLTNGSEPIRNFGSTSTIHGGANGQDVQRRFMHQSLSVAASLTQQNGSFTNNASNGALKIISPKPTSSFPVGENFPAKARVLDSAAGRNKLNNIDLNTAYDESQDCVEGSDRSQVPIELRTGPPACPSWIRQYAHQSSRPQTSGSSDSGSAQSPSSSGGDAQGRTDRIVFKLFGKVPNDFPLVLRAQVLDWLSHSPTDIESYIRPGCIVLTIYIRQADSIWEELCCNLSSSLSRLLYISKDPFLRTGWIYTRVQHQMAFTYNGQVVLDMPLTSGKRDSKILSIIPLAVSVSKSAQFIVKGFNLCQSTTRLLCALEGKYMVQEAIHDLVEGSSDPIKEDDELQCLKFACPIPDVLGRGFIEVEDHGLSSSFFPFIVAEQGICSEIRTLESTIAVLEPEDHNQGTSGQIEARSQALDFIHEIGWLFHRSHLRSRLRHRDPNSDSFTFTRFRRLMEFSMDHDWCAVVKKLLDILFEGIVDASNCPSVELALSEMGLLHRAVQKSSRRVVELLLRYIPDKASNQAQLVHTQPVSGGRVSFFFRPDAVGPAGLTPLHIAASRDGSGSLLDALTDDPGSVGLLAWKNARDNTGFTPEDYARIGGHFSYIHLIQKKIMKKSEVDHVILNVPDVLSDHNVNQTQTNTQPDSVKITGFEINKTQTQPIQRNCKLCDRHATFGKTRRMLGYRPAVLSMVGIAAVCVCLGLFFKSSPEVYSEFGPFRWELLDFGTK